MNFNLPPIIPNDVQRQLNEINKEHQLHINSLNMHLTDNAKEVSMNLYNEIIKFQNKLPNTSDVAITLVHFNQSITILVKDIGYIGDKLVCFCGEDNCGKPMELIQHIYQLNFLLMVVPKSSPETPKRKIGFLEKY